VLISALIAMAFSTTANFIQTRNLKKMLEERYEESLGRIAVVQRKNFDAYVKKYSGSVKILEASARFKEYLDLLETQKWSEENAPQIQYHRRPPQWFPDSSLMRKYIRANFVVLLDSNNRIREAYTRNRASLPDIFLDPDSYVYRLSRGEVLLTSDNENPYIVTAKQIFKPDGQYRGQLTIASQIDGDFLNYSLGITGEETLVALISGALPVIIASNNNELLPTGTSLGSLQDRYLIMKDNYFDYGNSDLLFEVAAFFPRSDVVSESAEIMRQNRRQHLLISLSLILFFTLGIFLIARQINRFTKGIIDFQRQTLGEEDIEVPAGDELQALEDRFANMAAEILRARETAKRYADSLVRERDLAQNYLDIAGVMLIVINAEQEVTLINKKGCEILALREDEIIGKNWFETFLPERSSLEVKTFYAEMMKGGLKPQEYRENAIVTGAGEERIIAWRNTLVQDENGEIVGTLSSGEDITELKRAERGKIELEEKLRQAQKMEAIGTMAGGIAHEFNNILAAMLGYTEMVRDEMASDSQQRADLDQVLAAGNRAKDLVKQILAFSRHKTEEFTPIQICDAIKEGIDLLQKTTPASIEVRQNISTDCKNVMANASMVHQVLINLYTNAVHAMDGKGLLEISLQEMTYPGDDGNMHLGLPPGEYLELTVSDSGVGIDPKILSRIFDPFFTTKDIGEGTGMGLSVVHGIIEKFGGLVTADSELGNGTSFHVYFPAVMAESVPEEEGTAPVLTGSERILFVDDELILAHLGKQMLERLGYKVSARTSSVEALEAFRVQPGKFDLIITDQTMPNITGDELAKSLLAIRPDIPIILCTGYSSKIDMNRAEEIGIRAFVMKPFNKRELAATIRRVLDGNNSAAAHSGK
jgi:PAS domain S-box-containing protein